MRQESWYKLQQRRDASICTFWELARANGQDQAGIDLTQETLYYTLEDEDHCRMSESEEELMSAVTTILSWQP